MPTCPVPSSIPVSYLASRSIAVEQQRSTGPEGPFHPREHERTVLRCEELDENPEDKVIVRVKLIPHGVFPSSTVS
jgi:hypothetical protein